VSTLCSQFFDGQFWEENLVDVETDSSYNNRPQPGCEAATQTFCPLVEQCTTKKLTIDIETANVKYSLTIDGVKVFLYKLGFCGSHRLAGTVISLACVHIMFTVLRRTVYVGRFNVN
jgi:hypothetical protein